MMIPASEPGPLPVINLGCGSYDDGSAEGYPRHSSVAGCLGDGNLDQSHRTFHAPAPWTSPACPGLDLMTLLQQRPPSPRQNSNQMVATMPAGSRAVGACLDPQRTSASPPGAMGGSGQGSSGPLGGGWSRDESLAVSMERVGFNEGLELGPQQDSGGCSVEELSQVCVFQCGVWQPRSNHFLAQKSNHSNESAHGLTKVHQFGAHYLAFSARVHTYNVNTNKSLPALLSGGENGSAQSLHGVYLAGSFPACP